MSKNSDLKVNILFNIGIGWLVIIPTGYILLTTEDLRLLAYIVLGVIITIHSLGTIIGLASIIRNKRKAS